MDAPGQYYVMTRDLKLNYTAGWRTNPLDEKEIISRSITVEWKKQIGCTATAIALCNIESVFNIKVMFAV